MAVSPEARLRGRDAQLAALDRHFSAADSGIGSVVIVEGAAGLGKTTLLRAVCGDVGVSGGRVIWKGRDITRLPTGQIAQSGLVRTFQQSMSFASRTVRENLHTASACRGSRVDRA